MGRRGVVRPCINVHVIPCNIPGVDCGNGSIATTCSPGCHSSQNTPTHHRPTTVALQREGDYGLEAKKGQQCKLL